MNFLTQIQNTQKQSIREVELGIADKVGRELGPRCDPCEVLACSLPGGTHPCAPLPQASWHDQFKHSAYIFAGGLSFQLTEGDVLAVFSQYGEIVDVHLVR